jgi:tRNA dimethylallyltransferase
MNRSDRRRLLVVVGGTTASGKTAVAIQLATHFRTEIVSADSRQFYREMSIGTAKPTPEELAQVRHYFINVLSIKELYSVGAFEKDALGVLDQLFRENEVVVAAGGSGLYLRALCEGLDEFPEVPAGVAQQIEAEFSTHGIIHLQEELRHADPEYFATVDRSNPVRLLRALGVIRASGRPFSSFRKKSPADRGFDTLGILLDLPKDELNTRIDARVEQMVSAGLVEEAKQLLAFRHFRALQTVGYQEVFEYLDGKMTLTEAIGKIKTNTRRFAKRQRTWFRKYGEWVTFHPSDFLGMVIQIEQKLS